LLHGSVAAAPAAVSGLPPARPERRRRPPIPLRGRPGVVITSPLAVAELGFSLHAARPGQFFRPALRELDRTGRGRRRRGGRAEPVNQ